MFTRPRFALLLIAMVFAPGLAAGAPAEHVILVTFDGLRWQEMFGGLDERLLNDEEGGMESATEYRRALDADTAEERRQKLLPFLWTVVAQEGVILGAPAAQCEVVVENAPRVSYPGYNELLSGSPDPGIRSNARLPNPNGTVLEWLNGKPAFAGRVSAFGSWEIFNVILNEERSGLPVNAGWDDALPEHSKDARLINELAGELPRFWQGIRVDIITHTGALDSLRYDKPKLLYVGYGETDDWAHDRRYDMYLSAAQRTDRYIRELWETAQSLPEFKGKTALVITTDHGRGDLPADWTDHGPEVPGCERIWIAAMGAGVSDDGVVSQARFTQGQVAATVAALLGQDYNAAVPEAAQPLPIIE